MRVPLLLQECYPSEFHAEILKRRCKWAMLTLQDRPSEEEIQPEDSPNH